MQAVRILNAVGVEYASVNVLDHPMLREEIKRYSDWPTIPQLYVKGDFVGGCDILTSMFNDGSLQSLMKVTIFYLCFCIINIAYKICFYIILFYIFNLFICLG